MAVFKCKMCGGSLNIGTGATVIECEYCGTKQTVPRLDVDEKEALYDRASHFRRNNEFDIAMSIYEQILAADKEDAEAYWSIVLCRYGIEYVEDGVSKKRIPTVNRAQFTSVFDDEDYKSALKYADSAQREIYIDEAKTINEIQKGILAISQKEKPFDIFICYKESDQNGRRTLDSVLAYDLYQQLTQEGYKVFFSRITLEDKLGIAYEPYIFAALNSAKVMLAIGTKPEHFNAVWVKNEWSRYLALTKKDAKKVLIPVYRDMDPYELPKEFFHLQAQDMAKIGFVQDLLRGIKKIIPEHGTDAPQNIVGDEGLAELFITSAFVSLKNGDFSGAQQYVKKVEDMDVENSQLYVAKLMIDLKVPLQENFAKLDKPFDDNPNYIKLMQYCDENTAIAFKEYNEQAKKNAQKEAKKNLLIKRLYIIAVSVVMCTVLPIITVLHIIPPLRYNRAVSFMEKGKYDKAISIFEKLEDYKDSETKKIISQNMSSGTYGYIVNKFSLDSFVIPDGVTSIGDNLFEGCSGLTSITIPDSVTSIGDDAFNGCTGLTSVIIPDSVTSIGDDAFNGCTGLTSVIIPDSVTNIGARAFKNCTGLTSITILDGVISIGDDAFNGCTGLTSVIIPDSVTSIGNNAFQGCSGLTSITILDGVISIGDDAFNGCTGLTSVIIPDSVTNIGARAFKNCTGLTSITIPDGVISIGNAAFYRCISLTSITIPDSVTSIGDNSFEGCSGLTSVIIPDSVTNIGASAFNGCAGLTSITIPDSVTSIGYGAFNGCTSLTSITIPKSVIKIGQYAFSGCNNLKAVKFVKITGWGISSNNLSDVNNAALYLTKTYVDKTWINISST